jgi:head-tail adaptor
MSVRDLCHAGALIYRVCFSKPITGKNPSTGEPLRGFTPVCERWAAMETISSRESVTNSRQDFSYSHRIVIRGEGGGIPFVAASWQVERGNRVFEVVSVNTINRSEWIEILVSESVDR